MPTSSPLLLDLAGVARLADVRRPVPSNWRRRFASTNDPFPPAAMELGGRVLFDAMSVAQWLARTEHGNNPDAVADAAADAAPADFDVADPSHVATIDALLALRSALGEPVSGYPTDELQRRAAMADPDDSCLVTEICAAHATWAEWADLMADAAYSPIQASRLLERRHAATRSSAGSSGPLSTPAEALLVGLAEALRVDDQAELVVNAGITPSLVAELVARVGDHVDLVVSPLPEGRRVRRRCLCDGLALPAKESAKDAPRLFIERLPSTATESAFEMLHAVDELVLAMRDHDRAIVLAPAAVLVETITLLEGLARTDVLRTGRVRAIAKLPTGLLVASPRAALALWVLGRESGDVLPADRFTAIADLTDTALTAATRADLTSDVLAAMGSPRDVHAHAFRFTRLVRTTSLLASRRPLVSGESPRGIGSRSIRDLSALLDQAFLGLGEDAPDFSPAALPSPTAPAAPVEHLIAKRHLKVIAGTRIAVDELSDSGLTVVGAGDLDDPARIGDRRVDPLVFAARHPTARLTVAGDVVFRTAPTAKAWVDTDGSKVVSHPARVLRISSADPGGLVPELVAADIEGSTSGPGAWRRWKLRRVVPQAAAPLRGALADLASRREALGRRIKALDTYANLLSAGVVSGGGPFTDHAADAASDY
jgi:hypothetical protein